MTNDTKAPKRIWAVKEPDWHDGNGVSFLGGTWDAGHLKEGTPHIPEQDALALVAAAYEDAAGITPMPPDCAPKGAPVLVSGGLAMKKTDGHWYSGMEEPAFERRIQWEVEWWAPIPNARKLSEFSRTPADAQAALEARDKRVRKEALREAADIVERHAVNNGRKIPASHNRILALVRQDDSMIEGDTDDL